MNAFISFFLSLFTFFMSIFAPMNSVSAPEDKSDFVPVVRFAVMSDTHLSGVGAYRCARVQKAISLAYSDAEQDKNYKNLDGVVFAGDLTDDGRKLQFAQFKSTVDTVIKDETQVMALLAKSHDGYQMDSGSLEFFTELTGLPADFHYVINGYHFIGLSRSKNEGEKYGEYQREWLTAQLDEAVSDDPLRPIFVFNHEHVSNTVFGSRDNEGWGISDFTDIYEKYPQIVHFSGHSHYPLNDPRSIWQGAFTCIGTGSINYAEFTVDSDRTVHPANYKEMAQFWIVEVDAENTLRLRGYDVNAQELLCEYYVENPANKQNREYTPDMQSERCSAPEFPQGSELKVTAVGGNYSITVPAAESTDYYNVFLYRAIVTGGDGTEKQNEYVMNNNWKLDCYDSVKISVKAEKGDTISVYAENSYGMRSAPLTVSAK